jgi:hypothetical protein
VCVSVSECAEDSFLARLELDELDAPLDANALLGQVLVQDSPGLGLRDEEQEWVGRVLEADVEEPHRDDALAGVDLKLRGVVAALDQRLREPEPSQNLERARLNGKRARFVHAIELPVDDADASAERLQLSRKRQPRRPRTDDQDVRVAVCRHIADLPYSRHSRAKNLRPAWALVRADILRVMATFAELDRAAFALVVDGLEKTYAGGTRALDGLTLRIPAGCLFGLLGPNGAGKTTLIGAAAGLVRAPRERLFVFGHDAVSQLEVKRIRCSHAASAEVMAYEASSSRGCPPVCERAGREAVRAAIGGGDRAIYATS